VTISALSMSVDPASYSGSCPTNFNFTAKFTLSAPAAISYQLEAGSDTPGFVFSLPAPVVGELRPAGEQTLPFTLSFSSTATGWVRLHITAPSDVASNQAAFTLSCSP
jgi:hypothetical protein